MVDLFILWRCYHFFIHFWNLFFLDHQRAAAADMICSLEFGIWNLGFVIWNLEFLIFGILYFCHHHEKNFLKSRMA